VNKLFNASDKIAIGLSFMCVLHCIALPLTLVALPSVTSLLALNDERFHLWLVFAVIPISLFAVLLGYLHHKRLNVLLISAVGLSMLVGAAMFGHEVLGEKGEVVLTLFGAVLIAYSHISNFRLRRTKSCDRLFELSL
jgi:hypothetical protein